MGNLLAALGVVYSTHLYYTAKDLGKLVEKMTSAVDAFLTGPGGKAPTSEARTVLSAVVRTLNQIRMTSTGRSFAGELISLVFIWTTAGNTDSVRRAILEAAVEVAPGKRILHLKNKCYGDLHVQTTQMQASRLSSMSAATFLWGFMGI